MKNLIDKNKWMRMLWMLVFMMGFHGAVAQEEFNPTNPPEPVTPPPPVVPPVKYRVSAALVPSDAGTVTVSGNGEYVEGERVTFNTRGNAGFVFKYWLKDGEEYTTASSFTYIMEANDVAFVAVYEYNPLSPNEPVDNYVEKPVLYPLWLKSYPIDACWFNITTGAHIEVGTWRTITATANPGFVFQGWYDSNGTLISANASFNYEMPNSESTLTARYVYSPVSPGDPAGGGQTDVDNKLVGDVDGDKTVDVTDAVAVINAFLTGISDSKYDVKEDGAVDVTDAVEVINIYFKTK